MAVISVRTNALVFHDRGAPSGGNRKIGWTMSSVIRETEATTPVIANGRPVMAAPVATAPAAAAPVATQLQVEPRTAGSNTIGLVALGLAIVGFIFAVLLFTAGIAWLLLVPAIVLGVVGLFRKNRRKGAALAAVIIAVLGLLLSFVGLRLPVDASPTSATGAQLLNNSGVNPFSNVTGGLFGAGQSGGTSDGADGGAGSTGAAGAAGTGTSSDGVSVGVNSVDCHTPLASVTGLNITGEVCAVSVAVTNNGTDVVDLDSADVSAVAGGTGYVADATLATGSEPLLDAQLNAGESTTGTVYVNLPTGATDIDSLSVSLGDDPAADVKVDLLK